MVTVRAGGPDDIDALGDLMFAEPTREAVVMAGSADRARRFRAELVRHSLETGATALLVADDDGTAVGFAEVGTGGEIPTLRVVGPIAIRSFGVVFTLVAAWRSTARVSVDFEPPPGGLHLSELQVDPSQRNRGIGAQLLEAVEAEARRRGVLHISLTTTTTNPAPRLYTRHGYEVVARKFSRRYERLTGSPGRVLMVKRLS
jgi:ribosomal protein S18 acetylase RimI-like enzyme